jgi:hypothetical protein
MGAVPAADAGQDGSTPQPSPSPRPSPPAAPDPPASIAGSVDRVVQRYLQEQEPCLHEREKDKHLPCFPVLVEQTREESVAESFRRWRTDVRPGTGSPPPTTPAGTPIVGISIDPCTLKSLLKRMGGNNTYYLYRVFDANGEGAVLRESQIQPATHGAFATYQYELVKEIKGPCEALAAWRALNREIWARNGALKK